MSVNTETTWKIVGDQLILQRNGDEIFPSAEQVYGSIIEKTQVLEGVPPGPPDSLPQLSFSRYPAQLKIEIDYKSSGAGTGLVCHTMAVTSDDKINLSALRNRKPDHIIVNEKWYPFAPGSVDEIIKIYNNLGISDSGKLTFRQFMEFKQRALSNDTINDFTIDKVIHPGIEARLEENALQFFQGELYPYQEDGWRWLSFICHENLGGILADEMGLGKTVQIIAVLAAPERELVAPSLIIAPSTLLENWRRELKKFTPSLNTSIHQGAMRTGLPATLSENDVVITSYETVVRDGALFDMIDWRIVVLDEAQAIKNPETRRARAVKKLKRNVGIAVTGTPVENRLRDLWSISDFVLPGYLGNEDEFEKHFGDGPDGAQQLEPFVSPIMLRRRIADVAIDLPERIITPQVLLLSDSEASEYERVRHEIIEEYPSNASLVSLTKLRMFCAHPWLIKDEVPTAGDPVEFSKLRRLLEIIEEIFSFGEKVLVFTSFNRMSDIIVDLVRHQFSVYATAIDGRVAVQDRQTIVDGFSAESGPALLALNPRAAGTGLNITAANHVIHYNLEWNPAVEDQASARAHRLGQEKPVTIHRLYFADTVDEAIEQRLERKRELSTAAVVGVSGKEEDYKDIVHALQMSPANGK